MTSIELVNPSVKALRDVNSDTLLKNIEKAARTCYKSESLITDDSAKVLVRRLIDNGHHAMIEHGELSYRVICDRGISHALVRHRLFSFAQESTIFCNYANKGVTFIIPPWFSNIFKPGIYIKTEGKILASTGPSYLDKVVIPISSLLKEAYLWFSACVNAAEAYLKMRELFTTHKSHKARSVLPNSLKTEIVITGNLRCWRNFFITRCSPHASLQMRQIANMLLAEAKNQVELIFDDIDKAPFAPNE